jgi:hypothetical protein
MFTGRIFMGQKPYAFYVIVVAIGLVLRQVAILLLELLFIRNN